METCSVDILLKLTEYYLSMSLYETAKFYAERLYYAQSNPQHLHLLASCFYRSGKVKQTYLLLQESDWAPNRYLLALSCFSLGKYSEAERALIPGSNRQPREFTAELLSSVPGNAAGLYLLGNICRRECRIDAAIDFFKLSIKVSKLSFCLLLVRNNYFYKNVNR